MDQSRPAPDNDAAFAFPHGEALLRNVMESAAVGMVLISLDGRIIYANPAFAALLGYTVADCVGKPVMDFVHPLDTPAAADAFTPMLHGEIDRYRVERRYRKRDGRLIWVMTSPSLVRDEESGEPLCISVQITDIDKQKRAEEALAASESRWNFALEGAGQGVWDHNLRTKTMFYSRMWRLMRGFAPDEYVDGGLESWMKRVHPDDRERILQIVLRQDSGEIPYNAFEYRERHRDGHYIWILSRGRPVEWFPDGQPSRIVGTDTDITSLKTVEAELAEEKERLRVTLHSIGDGVISTDARGRILFTNPVAEQMTGWTSADAMGRRVQEIFAITDEATDTPVADPVDETLRKHEPVYLNEAAALVSRSGERRAIRYSAAPVRAPDGTVIGAVLVFQDVTQSRALQKELAHSAFHDALTGLPNRNAFERALVVAVEQARHERREHALCFVDLDRFKQVNDTAGHAAGDALLGQISQAIRHACRSQDFAARIGGDEFAVLLGDCSVRGAEKVAQQIIDAIAAHPFTWRGEPYEIGASVGITTITDRGIDGPRLLAEADAACYAAKHTGRNRLAVFTPDMTGPQRFAQSA